MKPTGTIFGVLVVGTVSLFQADSLLAVDYVTVNLDVKYKSNGDFKKLKVKASNEKVLDLKKRGYICWDPPNNTDCENEFKLNWKATGLSETGIAALKIEYKNVLFPNSGIFTTAIDIDYMTPTADSGLPTPPVLLKPGSGKKKYYPFIYKVTAYAKDGTVKGTVDPDIMPHPP